MNTSSNPQGNPLARVFEAANCRTQEELAGLLGIRQSAVSDAKRRKSVPSEWLVCLFRLRSVTHEAADKAANKANSANKIYVRLGYIELPS